jgi:hypothetical protein
VSTPQQPAKVMTSQDRQNISREGREAAERMARMESAARMGQMTGAAIIAAIFGDRAR